MLEWLEEHQFRSLTWNLITSYPAFQPPGSKISRIPLDLTRWIPLWMADPSLWMWRGGTQSLFGPVPTVLLTLRWTAPTSGTTHTGSTIFYKAGRWSLQKNDTQCKDDSLYPSIFLYRWYRRKVVILVVIRLNPLSSSGNCLTDWMRSAIDQDLALKGSGIQQMTIRLMTSD